MTHVTLQNINKAFSDHSCNLNVNETTIYSEKSNPKKKKKKKIEKKKKKRWDQTNIPFEDITDEFRI